MYCNECKKKITKGIFQYAMDRYRKPLCIECQQRLQLFLDVKSGKRKIEYEKITNCIRCGKKLSEENKGTPYCKSCSREISNAQHENPFSQKSKQGTRSKHYINSNHYD